MCNMIFLLRLTTTSNSSSTIKPFDFFSPNWSPTFCQYFSNGVDDTFYNDDDDDDGEDDDNDSNVWRLALDFKPSCHIIKIANKSFSAKADFTPRGGDDGGGIYDAWLVSLKWQNRQSWNNSITEAWQTKRLEQNVAVPVYKMILLWHWEHFLTPIPSESHDYSESVGKLIEVGIVDIVNIQNVGSGLMWSTGNVGWVARLALKVQIPNALSRSTLRQKYNWE